MPATIVPFERLSPKRYEPITCQGLEHFCPRNGASQLGIQNLDKRSTIAYANEDWPSAVFQKLFAHPPV